MEQSGAICGDGMCPYIPCKDYPKCGHLEAQLKYDKLWTKRDAQMQSGGN